MHEERLETKGEGNDQGNILQTLIDISRIITTSHDLEETLSHTVELIAGRMAVDVCSIYLYDENSQELELKATRGLSASAVGQVRLAVHEGVVGLVIQEGKPVNHSDISHHPRFKFIPSIDEEQLSSFCGVPLIEFRKTLGVLAIQNRESRLFTPEEENLLIAIASQISGLISKALLVDRLKREADKTAREGREGETRRLEGVPIAPGVAKDQVIIFHRTRLPEPEYAPSGAVEDEKRALRRSIDLSEQEILAMIEDMTKRVGEEDASIFHSHLLFLEDRAFIRKINRLIEAGASAGWAVHHVVMDYLRTFQGLNDPYLKERGADLEDVGFRLLQHLGMASRTHVAIERGGVLVAEMLTPSDTALLDPLKIKAIVTSVGGFVSHAAILARSLRIPAVSGLENIFEVLKEGETVLVDGETGVLFVNPPESISKEYDRYQETRQVYLTHLEDLREVPCCTKDHQPVKMFANVSLAQDLEDVDRYGAEGIGLYRTEMHYLMSESRPTVDQLMETYARAINVAGDRTIIFRTLDLGADNSPPYMNFPREDNPFMGHRAIRYQLSREILLKEQLTAILKVAHLGTVAVVIPMISQLDELHQVKRVYRDCRREIVAETGEEPPEVPLGMLFEVPSSVLMCDLFAGEVDFFAIGTNDLTQYTLAVDRNNPYVNHLYDPLDPAVLFLIRRLVKAARRVDKSLLVCGEMASDPEGCLVLVGMGLRELSMNAPLIPLVKDRLAQMTLPELENVARIALNSTTAANVRRNIRFLMQQHQN